MELRRQLLRVIGPAAAAVAGALVIGCQSESPTVLQPPSATTNGATAGGGGAKGGGSFDDVAPAPSNVKTGTPTG